MAPTFKVERITGYCDNPIRNSAGDLIFGKHTLWEGITTLNGDKGSLEPNAFSYDFESAPNSSVDVTITVPDGFPVAPQYYLQGLVDSKAVLESGLFAVNSGGESTVTAKVTFPRCLLPFSLNADVDWELKQKDSEEKIVSADRTRLELYWISSDIHPIFLTGLSGIAIDLLRTAVPSLDHNSDKVPGTKGSLVIQRATQQAYFSYSKAYDNYKGDPFFGLNKRGQGVFQYQRYIQARPGGNPGSLSPTVNCYDQGAMVQVISAIGRVKASWLLMEPYGYINTTNLVGGINSNNPFFLLNNTLPKINYQDRRRTSFGNHVICGELPIFNPNNDWIFDACCGPHSGNERAQEYIDFSIDTLTNLYSILGTRPGTVANITQYPGVTSISKTTAPALETDEEPNEHLEKLVTRTIVGNPEPRFQAHWDDLANWVKTVLGDQCVVAYHSTHITETGVDATWYLTDVKVVSDGDLTIRVKTETSVGGDGKLDVDASSSAARKSVVEEAINTQFYLGPKFEEIDKLWVPADLDEYTDRSIQHAANIPRGRVLVSSGNTMIDIRGGNSSPDLVSVVRTLLKHTTVKDHPSLIVPNVTRHSVHVPEPNRGSPSDPEVVKGVGTQFEVECQVEGLVSRVDVNVEGFGLLYSKSEIKSDTKTSTVTFTFVTRNIGNHDVECLFAIAGEWTVKSEKINVKVVA